MDVIEEEEKWWKMIVYDVLYKIKDDSPKDDKMFFIQKSISIIGTLKMLKIPKCTAQVSQKYQTKTKKFVCDEFKFLSTI